MTDPMYDLSRQLSTVLTSHADICSVRIEPVAVRMRALQRREDRRGIAEASTVIGAIAAVTVGALLFLRPGPVRVTPASPAPAVSIQRPPAPITSPPPHVAVLPPISSPGPSEVVVPQPSPSPSAPVVTVTTYSPPADSAPQSASPSPSRPGGGSNSSGGNRVQ